MRKLRFRAWHTEQKRMIDVYGLGIDFLTENTLDGVDPCTNAFCGDDMNFLEIMQYIGVDDKNNTQVYEGDILWDSLTESEVKVVYDPNTAAYLSVGINDNWDNFFYELRFNELEVVGNIHERDSN